MEVQVTLIFSAICTKKYVHSLANESINKLILKISKNKINSIELSNKNNNNNYNRRKENEREREKIALKRKLQNKIYPIHVMKVKIVVFNIRKVYLTNKLQEMKNGFVEINKKK